MKYRDLIIIFLSIIFVLSLAFTISVNQNYWFLPLVLFIVIIVFFYEIWVKN
jgi:hypothetical protein